MVGQIFSASQSNLLVCGKEVHEEELIKVFGFDDLWAINMLFSRMSIDSSDCERYHIDTKSQPKYPTGSDSHLLHQQASTCHFENK